MLHAAPQLFEPLRPWAFGELAPHAHNLVVADPPWLYEAWSVAGNGKNALQHYSCYPPEEIAWRFPVGELAEPNCLLLMWATWPLFDRQLACVRSWGFDFQSVIVWEKVFRSGRPAIGTGYRVRSMCEPIILATRGEDAKHKPFPGLFAGIRREHSRKPEEFYDLVNRCCPRLTRRADVFARVRRSGWSAFGDELDKWEEAQHETTRQVD